MRVALITLMPVVTLYVQATRSRKRVTRARRQEHSIILERHHIHIGFLHWSIVPLSLFDRLEDHVTQPHMQCPNGPFLEYF